MTDSESLKLLSFEREKEEELDFSRDKTDPLYCAVDIII